MAAWAGLGYYARARNLVACAKVVVAAHGGHFPATEAELRTLPGIGDYTAAAIAAIAFGAAGDRRRRQCRASRRAAVPRCRAKAAVRARAPKRSRPTSRAGDFAQAMMDLGSAICTPRKPRCLLCPLREHCAAFAAGDQEAFPVKAAKAAEAATLRHDLLGAGGRRGVARAPPAQGSARRDARACRPGRGSPSRPGLPTRPLAADWTMLNATVAHGFTHFDLQLALATARVERHASRGRRGIWWPVESLDEAGLPTVFAKAAKAIGGA